MGCGGVGRAATGLPAPPMYVYVDAWMPAMRVCCAVGAADGLTVVGQRERVEGRVMMGGKWGAR